jgi:hypothetical protein
MESTVVPGWTAGVVYEVTRRSSRLRRASEWQIRFWGSLNPASEGSKAPSLSLQTAERLGWGAPSKILARERLDTYSGFVIRARWVVGAHVQGKLFVAQQLEVAHHFIERCSCGRTRRREPPATFGATKTSKTRVLNPFQLPFHSRRFRCAPTLSDCMPTACRRGTKRSPFTAAYRMVAAKNRRPVWA